MIASNCSVCEVSFVVGSVVWSAVEVGEDCNVCEVSFVAGFEVWFGAGSIVWSGVEIAEGEDEEVEAGEDELEEREVERDNVSVLLQSLVAPAKIWEFPAINPV